MYRGFNLKIDNVNSGFYDLGLQVYEDLKAPMRKTLKDFVSVNGVLDGSKLQEYWFPQINADAFISHSHKDERNAICIAGWLHHTFGITAFIDSCIWGFAGELLKMIDDAYCLNSGGKTYSYEDRNFSTAHVHMMLSTALQMMIDKTECLFFLNTPASISSSETVKSKTASPWLYSEIIMTQLLRRKTRESHREEKTKTFSKGLKLNEGIVMEHDIDLSGLTEINANGLKRWQANWKNTFLDDKYPLDYLYNLYEDGIERI